jgi:predicted transglutaminase-like cysteine proteinase
MTRILRRRLPWLAETVLGLAVVLALGAAPQAAHATITPFHYTPHGRQLPAQPDLFGSIAISAGHAAQEARWRQVMHEDLGRPGPWRAILDQVRGKAPEDRIRAINGWVNGRIQFASDQAVYGVGDYWASATESLTRGRGDCEDYAIAKLELLREAGVPVDDLYLVVAQDLVAREAHALAVVRVDDGFVVLDSRSDEIQRADTARDYRPIMTLGDGSVWVHGYAVAAARTAPRS